MTKFLIHGNCPWVKTGYGVQIGYLAERLRAAGHEVAISSTYGHNGGMGSWRGIPVYPGGYEVNGNDILHDHAAHFFNGDPTAGWIIPVIDVWALVSPRLADWNVAAWAPVDHYPAPPDVVKFFHRTDAVPVAMSRFGERMFLDAGLDPLYVPLAVDTTVYRPTYQFEHPTAGVVNARDFLGLDRNAFVVGMVAMNKGWARDRKGFNEALRAFGIFWQRHPDAVLYLHSEKYGGAEGVNLTELALAAGIPEHAIVWVNQYAYRHGFPPEQMAAAYTAMDVLLAPSHGEGFCVPLIEAQACGTPVIASNFSSQMELASPEHGAAGWLVNGQPEWDPPQHASYINPFIHEIVDALEQAYRADFDALSERAVAFAAQYDADRVFESHWLPVLDELTAAPPAPVERKVMERVDVLVPSMRDNNSERFWASFRASAPSDVAVEYIVGEYGAPTRSYAENVNWLLKESTADWVFVCGDDVEFTPGWVEAARKLSDRFDVIGTNDTDGALKNPDVAAGRHADHFFIRRSYIDEVGACLDGPGVAMPECYGHWWVDREVIELAKARGVFSPCLDSVVIHHHPGYDGREDLRAADPVYMKATESAEKDRLTFLSRAPLISMQRTSRAKYA